MGDKKPTLVVALTILVLLAGGFLSLVYIGASGRTSPGGHLYATLPGAASAPSAYFADAKAGGRAVAKRTESFVGGIFGIQDGYSGQAPAAGGGTASAGGEIPAGVEGDDNQASGDSFEKYYEKNYGGGDGSDGGGGAPSWADTGGSSSSGSPAGAVPRGGAKAEEQAAAAAAGGSSAQPGSGPAFGGPSAPGRHPRQPRMMASLPGGAPFPGSGSGGVSMPRPSSGGSAPGGGAKTSSLNGFSSGGRGAADLNGASENMKTASQGSYNSKMSVDVGAMKKAAAGAAGTPAPQQSSGGSGGGSSGGGSGGSGGSADGKTPDASAAPSGTDPGADDSGVDNTVDLASSGDYEDPDLIRAVVNERQNGTGNKFISEADAVKAPKEALLKAGGTEAVSSDKEITADDPENFNSLPEDRKIELKKEIHTFLKEVENKYGRMNDIHYTPCETTPVVCKDNGLTGNYLTMTTSGGARLDLGVKYLNGKWRVYTVNFRKPASAAASQTPAQDDGGADYPAD